MEGLGGDPPVLTGDSTSDWKLRLGTRVEDDAPELEPDPTSCCISALARFELRRRRRDARRFLSVGFEPRVGGDP